MPLVGLYSWSEKSDLIKVIVPLKGASPNKVDIFVTSTTLKVNFSPYLVDIVLRHPVDPIRHKATIKDGNLKVTLYKTEQSLGLWGTFEIDTDDKDAIKKIREESAVAQDTLEKELGETRKDRRTDDERFSLRKQMGLDEAERSRLDNLKLEEKTTAEAEVYETFSRMEVAKQNVSVADSKRAIVESAPGLISAPLKSKEPKEPVDFETYMKEKGENRMTSVVTIADSKDIFDVSMIPTINSDEEQFDNDDTDYSEAICIVDGHASNRNAVTSYHSTVIDEIDDVRYIPPPRVLSNSADGKGMIRFRFQINDY